MGFDQQLTFIVKENIKISNFSTIIVLELKSFSNFILSFPTFFSNPYKG